MAIPALDAPPRPLDHLTLQGAPDAPALLDRAGALSFAELEAAVGALAAWLAARTAPGDRVASWLAKTRLACLLPLACARAGLVHVPVNPLLKRAQVSHILEDSGAKLLISRQGRLATLEAGDLPIDCEAVEEAAPTPAGDALPPSTRDPANLVQILYTSGSTGRPKGVMLSGANLWLGAVSVATYLRLGPDDRALAVLPLSFDYGQNQLLSAWMAGGAAVPLDYLAPADVIRAVKRFEITTLAGVPPLWVQLADAAWPAATELRRLTNSGGHLPTLLVRRLRALFPSAELFLMYGLTEAFRSTFLPPAMVDAHPDAIGDAIPLAEVMLVRPDGGEAGPGALGELVHAGPLVAQGYWRDAERTARRFRPAPSWSQYGGTAAWSGDTLVRGADGLLRFVGRDDEMIKTAGNRVSPTEVEEAALASGLAAEAAAFGVSDPRLGQVIHLVVRSAATPDEAALRAHLKRELPNFMQPGRVSFRAELPRNPNGKLDRAKLRADAEAEAAA